ncbi:sensor histidine kinase [Poseidonocella sp. HB161398]|uniref:sensor histidine kinase n=1 Tax=Poseidonocella sp. HB161398 TaxID=2320855 RepID=UPI001108591A|nr:ATP-binding protein [Poseidonocella sp. HB161398]
MARGSSGGDLAEREEARRAAVARALRLSFRLSAAVMLLAGSVLVFGWGFGIDRITRVVPGWPALVPGTALLFLLAGGAVAVWTQRQRPVVPLAAGLAMLALLGSGALGRVLAGAVPAQDGMSLTTRLSFLLVALALCALPSRRAAAQAWVQGLMLSALVLSQVGLLGYLFDSGFVFGSLLFSRLSLPSAACFVMLQLAVMLAVRQPGRVHLLFLSGPGSQILRLLLPALLAGMAAIWLGCGLAAERGAISPRFGMAVMALASGWYCLFGLVAMAGRLNRAAEREHDALARLHDQALGLSRAEALAARLQKASALGRIAGGVAHDFNNLLTVIRGNLDLVAEARSQEETRRFLLDAQAATERGAELTQKLLSYGGKLVLDAEALMLDRKIRYLEGMLRRFIPGTIRLSVELGSGRRWIFSDRGQLEQAVISLVANACDAVGSAGSIQISTGYCPQPPRDAPELAAGSYLFVEVRDDGAGMSPDVLDRATDPFFTTKDEASCSGLGLSMVHGFCRQSGGYLQLESVPGQGTVATIYLPEAAAGQAAGRSDLPEGASLRGAG